MKEGQSRRGREETPREVGSGSDRVDAEPDSALANGLPVPCLFLI